MKDDTMLTTQEDDLVETKISRFCVANIEKLDWGKPRGSPDKKPFPQMDFSVCIKPSPFGRFSENRTSTAKGEFFSENENYVSASTTGSFVVNLQPKMNHFYSEVKPDDTPKPKAKTKYRKRRVKDPKMPFCTYPSGILRKGLESQYSYGFEKYIFAEAYQHNGLEDDDEDGNVEVSNNKLCYLSKASIVCTIEEAEEICEDEDRPIFTDTSAYNNKQTAVRLFPSRKRIKGPSLGN